MESWRRRLSRFLFPMESNNWLAGLRIGLGLQVLLYALSLFMIREYAVDMINEAVFEGIEAANADEAIEILESRSDIQMAFTDIHMPGSIDGLKLAHSARDWVRPKARTQNQPHKPVKSPLRGRMGRNSFMGDAG